MDVRRKLYCCIQRKLWEEEEEERILNAICEAPHHREMLFLCPIGRVRLYRHLHIYMYKANIILY